MIRFLLVSMRHCFLKVMNKKLTLSAFGCLIVVGVSIFIIFGLVKQYNLANEFENVKTEKLQKEELPVTTDTVEGITIKVDETTYSIEVTSESTDAVEEIPEEYEETSMIPADKTTQIDYGGPQTAGVIQVPTICGPKERLDPKKNICKRII